MKMRWSGAVLSVLWLSLSSAGAQSSAVPYEDGCWLRLSADEGPRGEPEERLIEGPTFVGALPELSWEQPARLEAGPRAMACFFEEEDLLGEGYCLAPGERVARPEQVSSILIECR